MAQIVPFLFSIFIGLIIINTNLIYETGCAPPTEGLRFQVKTVLPFSLESHFETPYVHFFQTAEERKKLCFYAKIHAKLAYLEYRSVPEWQKCCERESSFSEYMLHTDRDSPLSEKFSWGMYCPTMPTVYLLRSNRAFDVQITFVHYPTDDHYTFDEKIVYAGSVSLIDLPDKYYFDSHAEELHLQKQLNVGGKRKNLCARTRDYVSVDFLHTEVPEARLYKFELANESGEKFTTLAFPCPTSPKLYLCRGSSEKRLKIISLRGVVDRYEFELDDAKPFLVVPLTGEGQSLTQRFKNNLIRKDQRTRSRLHDEYEMCLTRLDPDERENLCTIARNYRVSLPVTYAVEMDVEEAQLYSFLYSEGQQQNNIAIHCATVPRMYLRWDPSESAGKKISITFTQNLADRFTYAVEVPDDPFQKEEEGILKLDESDYARLERHPFTRLSSEDQWNFCFAAQKYILSKGEDGWRFIFAEKEPSISANKLLLIPDHMKISRMYGAKFHDGVRDVDLYIICSEWPQLYLRLGKSTNEIIAMLNKNELVEKREERGSAPE